MTEALIEAAYDAARWALCADAKGAGKGKCDDDCCCLPEAKIAVNAALAAIRSAPLSERMAFAREIAPEEWLPIESAPKDGTRVLVYQQELLDDGEPLHWIDIAENRYLLDVRIKDEWLDGNGKLSCEAPTHWRPLPAHPATKDETK